MLHAQLFTNSGSTDEGSVIKRSICFGSAKPSSIVAPQQLSSLILGQQQQRSGSSPNIFVFDAEEEARNNRQSITGAKALAKIQIEYFFERHFSCLKSTLFMKIKFRE